MCCAMEILLVEDDSVDARLTQRALWEGADSEQLRVHVVADGEQAVAFLKKRDGYAEAPTPDLILLDLRLPRKDGYEVLEEIKADARLHLIPIVAMTTAACRADIARTYGLLANCCVVKPVDPQEYTALVQSIRSFWFKTVTLPSPRVDSR